MMIGPGIAVLVGGCAATLLLSLKLLDDPLPAGTTAPGRPPGLRRRFRRPEPVLDGLLARGSGTLTAIGRHPTDPRVTLIAEVHELSEVRRERHRLPSP
jgi:hypothetical protein